MSSLSHSIRLGGIAFAVSSVAILAGCNDSAPFDVATQIGPNPVLPEPNQYLFPPMKLAPVVGWTEGQTPTVPEGLKIAAFATGLQHPRAVYTLPNKDVLVVESQGPGVEPIDRPKDLVMGWIMSLVTSSGGSDEGKAESNRITLLRDSNGDGTPDMQTVFIEHLASPFGIVLVGGDLYVANTDGIVRYPYSAGDTQITVPAQTLVALPGGPIDHHWTKSLTASPDGTLLYVGIGSNSNVAENGFEAEKDRAAIWEVDRATGRHRTFASGLRNPNGLTFHPETGALWAVINERDELGPDLVPDYMTSVKDGAFYGWPYSYYGQHLDPRVMPQRPDLVASAIPPDYALSSHVAPLGLAFSNGSSLPADYANGAFIGEHGSWDRDHFNGYKVVYVPFSGGQPAGMARDVVTNFLNGNGEAQGRPVGVGFDATGALLVADDSGNTVWRVTADTARPTADVSGRPAVTQRAAAQTDRDPG